MQYGVYMTFLAKSSTGEVGFKQDSFHNVIPRKPDVRVELRPAKIYENRLLTTDGQPVANATVELNTLLDERPDIAPEARNSVFVWKFPGFTTTTDANGVFKFEDIPIDSGSRISVKTASIGYGTFSKSKTDQTPLRLVPVGTLELHFVDAAGTKSLVSWPTVLQVTDFAKAIAKGPVTSEELPAPTPEGLYRGIFPGKYELSLDRDVNDPRFAETPAPFEIVAGKTTTITLKTTRAATLSGTILDHATGKGLGGVPVNLSTQEPFDLAKATTDASGRYSAFVRGGNTYHLGFGRLVLPGNRFYSPPPAEQYLYTPNVFVPIGKTHEFPLLTIREGRIVKGTVVRTDGKPLTNPLEVRCPTETLSEAKTVKETFTFVGLPHDTPLIFRVRSGNAVNIPGRIEPQQLGEAETFKVGEENAVKFAGRIEDKNHRGIAGVDFTLVWFYNIQGSTQITTEAHGTVKTNADGFYTFDGAWPKERYFFRAEDPRIGAVGNDHNATQKGEPGETLTFKTLEGNLLAGVPQTIGSVVHLDGTPVVGAMVQTCGETPKPVVATTDAKGTYTFKGLPDTKLFLTVAKPGYWPTYHLFQAGATGPKLTFRRTTDPAPAVKVVAANEVAARRKIATEIFELTWSKRADHRYGYTVFQDVLNFDRDMAERWAAAATGAEATRLELMLKTHISDDALFELALKSPE